MPPSRPRRRPFKTELRHRINAGRVALRAQIPFFKGQFGNVECDWKEDDTRVTFADFAISEKILGALRADFPLDDCLSEESDPDDEVHSLRGDFAWVLDPIDGTNNYYLGLPWCAISLALLHEGRPIYGLFYDFSRDHLVEGGPGHGLWDNARRIDSPKERNGLCGLHFPLKAEELAALGPLLKTYRVRSFGSSALNLALAALGKLDGAYDGKVHVWDIAAGCALIEAAGGEVCFLRNDPFPLQLFHVRAPHLRLIAGSPAFLAHCQETVPGLFSESE
ncbi:MAG: inositol monophosphatase family protein [Opitutales bacterium]